MADRDGGKSKWSGAREREERQRQRDLERERGKQARLAREAGADPPEDDPSSASRRLTDEERQTIREYRFPPPESSKAPKEATDNDPTPAEEPVASSPEDGQVADRAAIGSVGTRWRDSVSASGGGAGDGGGLPNLPGDDDGNGGFERPSNARLVIFGLALLLVMAALAFMPFGPFGGNDGVDDEQRPTPSQTLPSIFVTEEADAPDDGAQEPDEPVAEAGQGIVCIDPGHGGWDTGWDRTDRSEFEYGPPSVIEAEINLGMAYMLKAELEEMGYFVVLTRPSGAPVNMFDEDVNDDGETRLDAPNPEQAGARDELQARINVCNEAGADILVSVHIDGFDDPSARGFQVFYTAEREFGEQNALLASLIFRRMFTASEGTDMVNTGGGARPDTDMDVERYETGTAKHYLILGPEVESISITPSEMPGVIVEAAFLSNDIDAVWIAQPNNQRLWIEAYALGIRDYFEQYPPAG